MTTRLRSSQAALFTILVAFTMPVCAESPPLPAGILNFAGRLSHNHGYLFGEAQRVELDSLNRELRESDQQLRDAGADAVRQTAATRGAQAVGRLHELVKKCPRLLRIDLTADRPAVTPVGAVEQPGDTGALLLEVVSSGEGLSFSSNAGDLAQPRGESSQVTFDVAANGTTYAIASLDHLPFGLTTLQLQLNRPDGAKVRLPLGVKTPMPGRLKLKVLSDDTGKPVPAMVRLMWRTDGLQRQPANGIEFAPQFDGQGSASGVRAANLPGPLGAHFWCVPGPFDMMLAPGVWQIGVRRGVEHQVVFENV